MRSRIEKALEKDGGVFDVHYYTEVKIDFKGVKASSAEEAFRIVDEGFDFYQIDLKNPQFDIPGQVGTIHEVAWTEGQAICALIDGPDGEVALEGDGSRADSLAGSKSYFAPTRFEIFQTFVNEISEAFQEPEQIEATYGMNTVFDVLKFQHAIMMDTKFEPSSDFSNLVSILPSASRWNTYFEKRKMKP